MRILFALLALSALSACASTKVVVEYDSCHERGVIDGARIYECKVAEKVSK